MKSSVANSDAVSTCPGNQSHANQCYACQTSQAVNPLSNVHSFTTMSTVSSNNYKQPRKKKLRQCEELNLRDIGSKKVAKDSKKISAEEEKIAKLNSLIDQGSMPVNS